MRNILINETIFLIEKAILWIEDLNFIWKQWFEVKKVLMDLFFTNTQIFTSQDINLWTGVMWIIVMFLSAVLTHSDGTHSLQRIHWWASEETIYIFNGLISAHFHLINIPLTKTPFK